MVLAGPCRGRVHPATKADTLALTRGRFAHAGPGLGEVRDVALVQGEDGPTDVIRRLKADASAGIGGAKVVITTTPSAGVILLALTFHGPAEAPIAPPGNVVIGASPGLIALLNAPRAWLLVAGHRGAAACGADPPRPRPGARGA